MPVWHTTVRLGKLGIKPSKDKIDTHGERVTEKGIRLNLVPEWMGDDGAGPEIIDTDNMSHANVEALESIWGDEWKEKLEKWIERYGPKFGIKPGRGPERQLRVKITASDLALLEEAKKAKGKGKSDVEPSTDTAFGTQKVVDGTRTLGKK